MIVTAHSMEPNFIIIQSNDSTNPVAITLDKNLEFRKMKLIEYTIDGVPVTAGKPDELYYNLTLDDTSLNYHEWHRNDNLRGIPLPLTGQFTHETISPGKVVTLHPTKNFARLHVHLTNASDGRDAIFSRFIFLFEIF